MCQCCLQLLGVWHDHCSTQSLTQHCDQNLLWQDSQWLTTLCIKIWQQCFCECVWEGKYLRIIGMVRKRHCPSVVVQLDFDLFWCPRLCQCQRCGWRGHGPELSVSKAQSPEAVFGPSGDFNIPWHRRRGHTQEPVLITSCFHDPMVTSWTEGKHGHHFGTHVEALWVVGAAAGLPWVVQGG